MFRSWGRVLLQADLCVPGRREFSRSDAEQRSSEVLWEQGRRGEVWRFPVQAGCDGCFTDLSSHGTIGTFVASLIFHFRMCWTQITEDTVAAQATSGLDLSCLPYTDIECFLPMRFL